MINKIKTYIKHKIHNIKMMIKLFRNAWKLNSIITWYEQHQTLPNQIRDINDNIYDIDSKCDDNYYKIEDIENQSISRRLDDIDDEIKKLKTSNNSLIHNQKKYMNDDDDYLYKPLKFKGNEGYYEWLKTKTNNDNLDKCAEEIVKLVEKFGKIDDIEAIKDIISKYINLSKKGGE